MTYIPSIEIRKPDLHADILGYTFVWNGHFLRGIYPESVKWAKTYFESGFIEEVVEKGLFPKTWVSDFENEQFGLIIEHEMISPVLYAMDWNSAMLKDAALLVLEIAEIGWKYGYNMVDCHKLNVLFKNNRPLYVDLGSFVPKETGSTGWKPYQNFLESYTYILDLWTHGCAQIAKRMMSPGVTFHSEDYFAWKYPIYRHWRKLLLLHIKCHHIINRLASVGNDSIGAQWFLKISKKIVDFIKPSASQHFNRIRRRLSRVKVELKSVVTEDYGFDSSFVGAVGSVTCINIKDERILNDLVKTGARVISVNEDDGLSNGEYVEQKEITSVSYPLLNGGILVRNKFPESRFCSNVVLSEFIEGGYGRFSLHNSLVYLNQCFTYSTSGKMYVLLPSADERIMSEIGKEFVICRKSKDNTLVEVAKEQQ